MSEAQRLAEAREGRLDWRALGPYLSERQWGTVREDTGTDGNSWESFPHGEAVSRAYRWGEDGIAGISDRRQLLCFALALWNGRDPVLKERLFGVTNGEGNHGEDVKEYYFYLDNTPTHSYMRYLYKYPQAEFPYAGLVDTSKARGIRRPGVRAPRYGRVPRGPLLRRRRRVREGGTRRHPDTHPRDESRPGSGAASPAPHAVVPQRVVLVRGRGEAEPPGGGRRRARVGKRRRRLPAPLRGRAPAPLHRERDGRHRTVREGRDQPVRRSRRGGRG